MKDREIYRNLLKLKNLKPSKETNKVFSSLVKFAMNPENKKSLSNKECENLRSICSVAESEMENYWANKIINSANPSKTLEEFWYYHNYDKLSELEWNSLQSCCNKKHIHKEAVFIGSGPLPLTAILLAKKHKVRFLLVDTDEVALSTSRKLIEALKLSKYFTFSSSNFEKIDLKKYEIVFLAALVGQNEKERITEKVLARMSKGSHLLCRSAYDNRDILYMPLNIYKMSKLPIREIRTYDEIINSILIFKK